MAPFWPAGSDLLAARRLRRAACLAARARQSAFALPRPAHERSPWAAAERDTAKGAMGSPATSCEKKIVNCLRHGTLGMSGFFLQGGYLPVPDLRAQLGISERAFQAALDVDAR